MAAVPVADPRVRKLKGDLSFKPIPSPIFALGHQAKPSVYREIEPGHLVLEA
jgi:peptide/nickel transport system ATP-binding protein/glutathione transport system ATP-binding protein